MSINSSIAKKWLRGVLRLRRKNINKKNRSLFSRRIARRLISSKEYRSAKSIGVYLSFGSEVDTRLIINRAWADKKKVLIPITLHGVSNPFFCEYLRNDTLRKTSFGPLELSTPKKPIAWKKIDLICVPGLGYDDHAHRIGYGGGTYDRILSKTPRAFRVGLFFSAQYIRAIPAEKHDRRLDLILTEKGVHRVLAKTK